LTEDEWLYFGNVSFFERETTATMMSTAMTSTQITIAATAPSLNVLDDDGGRTVGDDVGITVGAGVVGEGVGAVVVVTGIWANVLLFASVMRRGVLYDNVSEIFCAAPGSAAPLPGRKVTIALIEACTNSIRTNSDMTNPGNASNNWARMISLISSFSSVDRSPRLPSKRISMTVATVGDTVGENVNVGLMVGREAVGEVVVGLTVGYEPVGLTVGLIEGVVGEIAPSQPDPLSPLPLSPLPLPLSSHCACTLRIVVA